MPPVLFMDCVFVWEAFVALSNPRNNQFIVVQTKSGQRVIANYGSIKFSEIEAYLNLNGISNLERRQEVTHLIRIMDESFITFMRERLKQENAST